MLVAGGECRKPFRRGTSKFDMFGGDKGKDGTNRASLGARGLSQTTAKDFQGQPHLPFPTS
eukprot:1144869-Pelagomonas_calceolata.AAC.3